MDRQLAERRDVAGEAIDVFGLLAVLKRRKRLVAGLALLGLTAGALIGKQITPTYTTRALIVVDPQEDAILGDAVAVQALSTNEEALLTQLEVIRSPIMVSRVMEQLDLFSDPEFNPALRQDERGLKEAVAELVEGFPGRVLIAAGLASSKEAVAPSDHDAALNARLEAMQSFRQRLSVSNDGGTYVIGIAFTSHDPEKAARIANRTADTYIAAQLAAKREASGGTAAWLDRRIMELREEVNTAERAVEQFRAANDLVGINGFRLSETEVGEINRELITARAELAGLQARLRQARSLQQRGELSALGEALASPVIADYRQREADLSRAESEAALTFGDRHPRRQQLVLERQNITRAIDDEVSRRMIGLQNEVQAAAIKVSSIEGQLAGGKGVNTRNLEAEVRLRELERNATAARQLYETLLQRYKEVAAGEENIRPDLRVMAVAEPPRAPSSAGPKLLAVSGLVVMTMVGSALALVLERSQKGLRSSADVRDALGLPVLGLIPEVRRTKSLRKIHEYLRAKPMSIYGEAIRATHTALREAKGGEPAPKLVLVTSALPSEGKTTLAISLAVFSARLRQRTLLVDLDLRHPMVGREIGPQLTALGPGPGSRDGSLRTQVYRDEQLGIDLLGVDGRGHEPAALCVQHGPLHQLLSASREQYDLVIVNSAPVLGVTDTALLARLADRVAFAVRWNHTPAEAARHAVQILRETGANVAGAALTVVNLQRHASYGYHDVGSYYGSSRYVRYYQN